MTYGYIRTSSKDQSLARQEDALIGLVEPENIFSDQSTGANFDRPGWKALMDVVQPHDLIIIKSVDRLGRNYSEIIKIWNDLTKVKGIDIKVLDMPLLDTTYCKDILGTFISDLTLQIFSFQAEQERNFIKQRQAEGITSAKARGIKFGRPKAKLPDNFDEIYRRFMKGQSINSLAKLCPEISQSTLRTRLYERMNQKGQGGT